MKPFPCGVPLCGYGESAARVKCTGSETGAAT